MERVTVEYNGERIVMEVPDGMSDDDIFAFLDDGDQAEGEAEEETPFNAAAAAYQFFQGAQDLPQNLIANMMKFDAPEEERARIEEYQAKREAGIEEVAGDASDLWRLGGEIAGGGITGAPAGSTRKIGKDVAERIVNAATEAGMFAGMTPQANVGEGAAIGAGIGTGVEAVVGTARAIPGIPGKVAKVVDKLFPQSQGARQADEFAESRGLPVAGEDLVQNQVVRGSGRLVDAMDPTNFRNRQLREYKEGFQSEVVDPFSEFDDPITEMAEGFQRKYDELNTHKRALYKQAWDELNPMGPQRFDEFGAEMDELLEQTNRVYGEGSQESKAIQKWLDYEPVNFQEWNQRRKKLGRDIRKLERASDPDTVDLETLRAVRSSLDRAMDSVGEGASEAYRNANEFFRTRMVPYRQEAFKKLIGKEEIEKVTKDALAKSPTAQTQKRFKEAWSALDERGRRAYRQSMLEQVMKAAKNPETGFSPDRAATMLDQLDNRLGPDVIGPEMREALKGWNNLFRQSGFAGEQVARSRTGSSLTQIGPVVGAVGAGALMGPKALIALTPMLPAILVRSRKVRQMLAKLAKIDPKHPDYATVSQDIMSEVGREAARIQALEGGQE